MSIPLLDDAVSVAYSYFYQAEAGIRDLTVTGVQTCALPISAPAGALERFGDGPPSGLARRPVQGPRVDHGAFPDVRLAEGLAVPVGRRDHHGNGQAVCAGEHEVPGVVRRHGVNRAGAVGQEDI